MSDLRSVLRPKISIHMPVRNTSRYLHACLDSILNQSEPSWELIAVDDHSTDNSTGILAEYASGDHRIRWMKNSGHGIVEALQSAFRESNGEMVCRMDSDDVMPEHKLELLSKALSRMSNSVSVGKVSCFRDGTPLGNGYQRYALWLNRRIDQRDHWNHVYQECVVPSCAWMMRRKEFVGIGGFDSFQTPEDYDLCLRMRRHNIQIIGVDDIVHHWRDRPDRVSRIHPDYADNRFFKLKLHHFMQHDLLVDGKLVLWGASKNGKSLVLLLRRFGIQPVWVCENPGKIGKEIYDITLQDVRTIQLLSKPQVLIAVSDPEARPLIAEKLNIFGLKEGSNYWFFT